MPKRVAKNQMTHDNWMVEDEEEDPGSFAQAATDQLQNRNIRKAKRRISEGKNGVPSSPFAKFSGFVGVKTSSASPFSFLASKPTANGNGVADAKTPTVSPLLARPAMVSTPSTVPKSVAPPPAKLVKSQLDVRQNVKMTSESTTETNGREEYLQKLKQLNSSFLSWVQQHMNKNVFYDFTPVCVDYIEHAKNLQTTVVPKTVMPLNSVNDAPKPAGNAVENSFLNSVVETPKQSVNEMPKQAVLFKDSVDSQVKKSPVRNEAPQAKPSVSFSFLTKPGIVSTPPAPTVPFSFSSQVASTKAKDSTDAAPDDDDNYVPPKNEFEAVVEADSVYSRRCKLFFKKDDNYVEKGVGMLHLKQQNGKTQLLVRNDTSIGTILLNIDLSSSLPMERVGKNNVMVVCVPNPKEKSDPTPVLFRVKTSEDADELLGKLNQYKT